jgi:polygalacturonase
MLKMSALLLATALAASAAAQPVCTPQAFGAKVDGVTLDTAAIQKAIDDCASKGGGTVKLAGAPKFISAPLILKSHITLDIAAGTTLEGSTNHDDYPEIEVFHDKGRQSLLSATGAEDITIRGGGVIDGRGESWWNNRAPGSRRPRLIVFDHCKHILMENVTVQNSPMWQIVPYYTDDITFRNMKILAPLPDGHNTDGIDPFSSSHIVIDHVLIDTGDDNVAIKSGQPGSPGPDAPTTDVTITDCIFLKGHGLSIGSEVAGGVQRVHVERVQFKGTTQGIRIKSGRDRGNNISDLSYKDITMEGVVTPIQITMYYGGPKGGADAASTMPVTRLTPHFHDIHIENLKATGARSAIEIEGLPESPVQGIVLKNVQIEAAKGAKIAYAEVNSLGLIVKPAAGPPMVTGPGFTGSLK